MKKFLFVLLGVFVIAGAFAAGENVPTSKSYVDSKLGEKQDIIPANDGAAQVLTNTGTVGEYGTKGIYDANGAYATQTQNLVDAATMNAGVQNAINSEFQCIEWLDPNDHSSDCLLLDVFGQTERRSPNLFDARNAVRYRSSWTRSGTHHWSKITDTSAAQTYGISVEPNKTYTIYKSGGNRLCITCFNHIKVPSSTNLEPDDVIRGTIDECTGEYSYTFTTPSNCVWILFETKNNNSSVPDAINIQITEGTTATPYVPYGNLYLPTVAQ